MALKDNWKETGKGLGNAFANLGKTLVRSAETTADKVSDWANGEKPEEAQTEAPEKESTVYNDGSWRKTGKELGSAFAGLGKTLVKTAETGADKAADWADNGQADKGAEAEETGETTGEAPSDGQPQ